MKPKRNMTISHRSHCTETPLLQATVDGSVDYKGRPVYRANSGGWRSAYFIIGVEMAERFAYYGISSNLITYLTGPLAQSTATAAENVNIWSGTASLLPLLGAFVADSCLGRHRTIFIASVIYILGLGLLTLSAMLPPSVRSADCLNTNKITSCNSASKFQVMLFFFSLYLVAIGQGGHKPCVQAFGADQFDEKDPVEFKLKGSFFNWWYFGLCSATLFAYLILFYIQENLNWALGFGIPCISMGFALLVFLLGTPTYRYSIKGNEKSPFLRIGLVFVVAVKNWKRTTLASALDDEEQNAYTKLPHENFDQYKFLNKALLPPDDSDEYGSACSVKQIKEAKAFLRLVPIWITNLVYAIVSAQSSTFFTKQGAIMDRWVASDFEIPAASIRSFLSLAIVLTIPMYDCLFVPIARYFTGTPGGITMLQRIGTGMFLSVLSMVIAALVETKRLKTAEETNGMSVCWLIPQYVVSGVSEAFTMVGLQEFFYDQVPNEIRSVGLSLYLSIFGVGSFLSTFMISVIEIATGGDGHESWFANDLNKGHLDYFYWLLAGLSSAGLLAYMYFAKSYIYNNNNSKAS